MAQIKIRAGEAVYGGLALGLMTAAGNPWTVSDAFAQELVNRGKADFIAAPSNPSGTLTSDEVQLVRGVVSGAGFRNASPERHYKPVGQTVTLGSTASQTWQIKAAIPADADEIALSFYHHDTSNALTGVRACVAATESFYPHSTTDDKFHPFVQGTGRRVLDDATSLYGWRSTTWGGAVSPTLAQPSSAITGVLSISDFTPLPPDVMPSAADIAAGGDPAFRYVMARVFVPGAAGNKYAFSPFTPSTARSVINAGWVTRFSQASGDIVTTAINTSTGDYTNWLPVGILYRSRSRGKTMLFSGDSLTQNQGAIATDEQMMSWGTRACSQYGNGRAWSAINLGCASQTQATYLAAVQYALPLLKPHAACFQTGSPNDGPFATLLAMQQYTVAALGRVHEFLKLCDQYRVLPVLATWPPCASSIIASSATGLQIDTERRAHNDRIRSICSAGGAVLFDYDALITDAGNVDAQGVRRILASLTGDGTHTNETGTKALATGYGASVLPLLAG